jgi:hypothetical protein
MAGVKSKVFVSCGQHSQAERDVARSICALLEQRGFAVYLAVDVQTLLEINERIIGELKNSDCYLFVNFCRDPIRDGFRGSLFSNQEFAIAYALGFERLLVVNQEGIVPEGMLRYVGINTESFRGHEDCLPVVARAFDRAAWATEYSRRLSAGGLRFSVETIHFGNLAGKFLCIDIHNDRPDIAALEATARLSSFSAQGRAFEPSPVRSPLKATARQGFSHTIFPKSHEAFDLLCIGWHVGLQPPAGWGGGIPASGAFVPGFGFKRPADTKVYLNCALDVYPVPALPIGYGVWNLRFEFFAIDFPVLSLDVELDHRQGEDSRARILLQDVRG